MTPRSDRADACPRSRERPSPPVPSGLTFGQEMQRYASRTRRSARLRPGTSSSRAARWPSVATHLIRSSQNVGESDRWSRLPVVMPFDHPSRPASRARFEALSARYRRHRGSFRATQPTERPRHRHPARPNDDRAIAAWRWQQCLLAATACGSGDDESAESPPATATEEAVDDSETTEPSVAETTATTEAPAETTTSSAPPSTVAPETTDPGADEPLATDAPAEIPLLDFEFQPVPAGTYRVETIGAPFSIDASRWLVGPAQSVRALRAHRH